MFWLLAWSLESLSTRSSVTLGDLHRLRPAVPQRCASLGSQLHGPQGTAERTCPSSPQASGSGCPVTDPPQLRDLASPWKGPQAGPSLSMSKVPGLGHLRSNHETLGHPEILPRPAGKPKGAARHLALPSPLRSTGLGSGWHLAGLWVAVVGGSRRWGGLFLAGHVGPPPTDSPGVRAAPRPSVSWSRSPSLPGWTSPSGSHPSSSLSQVGFRSEAPWARRPLLGPSPTPPPTPASPAIRVSCRVSEGHDRQEKPERPGTPPQTQGLPVSFTKGCSVHEKGAARAPSGGRLLGAMDGTP